MSFDREGLIFIAIAALVAAGTYALALNRRSWPLWLLAFALTIVALWVAYFFRDVDEQALTGGRARREITGPITRRIVTNGNEGEKVKQLTRMGLIRFGSRVDVFLPLSAQMKVRVGALPIAGSTEIAHLGAR